MSYKINYYVKTKMKGPGCFHRRYEAYAPSFSEAIKIYEDLLAKEETNWYETGLEVKKEDSE